MSLLLALAYVSALGLAAGGLAVGADPAVMARLPYATRPRSPGIEVRIGRRLASARTRESVRARLSAAGADPRSADGILGRCVLLALAGGTLALSAPTSAPGGRVVLALVVAAAAYRAPQFLLARRGAARRERLDRAVPDLLDLVSVAATAGLTPRLALDRATDVIDGPLGSELAWARRRVRLGTSWLEALRTVADRTGAGDLRRLAVTLERAQRLGSPVSERLRGLARDVRAEHRARQEERSRRAPVTMLFPLVFLILPAFVLAAVVPAVLVATSGI